MELRQLKLCGFCHKLHYKAIKYLICSVMARRMISPTISMKLDEKFSISIPFQKNLCTISAKSLGTLAILYRLLEGHPIC